MEKLELSIIVPIYNVAEYLAQCLESILAQTFQDFELILVDDGSTDMSGRMCDEYQKSDARIKVIHKENGGLISAKKAGLRKAKGEYIGFVDGDDWIDEDMYEVLCREARRNNADVVITDNDVWLGNRIIKIRQGARAGLYKREQMVKELYPKLMFTDNIFNLGVSPSLCNKIIRRELLLKFQFEVDEQIKGGEDAACSYPCILQAQSLFYVKDFFPYHYRVHKKSMTHSRRYVDAGERLTLINHMYHLRETFSFSGMEQQVVLYSIRVVEELMINIMSFNRRVEQGYIDSVIEQIKGSEMWGLIREQNWQEKLPKRTNDVLEYVEDKNRKSYRRIIQSIRVDNLKRFIKKIIYKE